MDREQTKWKMCKVEDMEAKIGCLGRYQTQLKKPESDIR